MNSRLIHLIIIAIFISIAINITIVIVASIFSVERTYPYLDDKYHGRADFETWVNDWWIQNSSVEIEGDSEFTFNVHEGIGIESIVVWNHISDYETAELFQRAAVYAVAFRRRAGWPLHCVEGLKVTDYTVVPPQEISVGFLSHRLLSKWTDPTFVSYHDQRLLPYMPLPVGFIINILFYAMIFLISVVGLRWSLRQYRIRHGLCPTCGYCIVAKDSPVCSECGNSLN